MRRTTRYKTRSDKGRKHTKESASDAKYFSDLKATLELVKRLERKEKVVEPVEKPPREPRTIKQYRQEQREKLLPISRQCEGCGEIKLNSKQWVVLVGPLAICLKCFRQNEHYKGMKAYVECKIERNREQGKWRRRRKRTTKDYAKL